MTEQSDTKLAEPGELFAGYYEIIELAGVGGYAEVYRARAVHLETEVAVKILDSNLQGTAQDAFLQRFYREALLTSVLNHPNTVTPIDYGRTEEGSAYIVMELLEGESVADVIDDGRSFELSRVRQIIADVLESLAEAHDRGIVHSDIKSSNIFLQTGSSQARVLDFGVASLIDDNDTDISQVFGTPHYIAPEAAVGNAITAAADIYSLGITAYEMVYQKLPYDAEDSQDILKAHVLQKFPPFSQELEADPVGAFIKAATAKSPSIRPSAREALKLLDAGDSVEQHRGADGAYHTPRPGGRRHSKSLRMRVNPDALTREKSRTVKRGQTSYKLREAVHEYFSGDGGVVYLRGPRGVGKDRMVRELVASKDFPVSDENILYMDADECRTEEGYTDIAMLLEQMPVRFPGMSRIATPAQTLADGIREHYNEPELLHRFVELIAKIAEHHRFVWFLSSVERVDAQCAQLLAMLFDRFSRGNASFVMILAVSTDEPVASRETAYILKNLAHEVWDRVRTIDIAPLPDREMRKLVESLEPMAENVIDMLVNLSEGNPGKMKWLLRAGKKRNLLRAEHGRLVMRLKADFGRLRRESDRNKQLRNRLRAVLDEEGVTRSVIALSFLGEAFTESTGEHLQKRLKKIVEKKLPDVLKAVVDRNIVARTRQGNQPIKYTFHHHSAIEMLQNALPEDELDRIIVEAAQVLETQSSDVDSYIRSARLYSRSGSHERAARIASKGARQAFDSRDYERGLDLFSLAYSELQQDEGLLDPELRCEIETHLGRCRMETGAVGSAEEVLLTACERAQQEGLEQYELECHLLLAEIGVIRGDSEAVGVRARRMLQLARSFSRDSKYYVRALLLVGKYSRNSGKQKQAAKWFVQAEKIAEHNEFPLLRANARMGIARILEAEGQHARAEQLMGEAIQYFRRAEDYGELIEALVELGNVRLNRGRSAESLFTDAERLAEEQGHGRMLADILAGQGRAMASRGELDSASILLLRAIERYRQLNSVRGEAQALLALAETSFRRKQIEAAKTYAAESIEAHRKARDAEGYEASLLLASEVALSRKVARDVVVYAKEAVSRLGESRPASVEYLRAMMMLGKGHMMAGSRARAQAVLARALAEAESRRSRSTANEIRELMTTASERS